MTKTLKIENRGDAFRKETIPTIRLKGKWLQKMGFIAGQRVELHITAPGVMVLRCLAPLTSTDFQHAIEPFAKLGL